MNRLLTDLMPLWPWAPSTRLSWRDRKDPGPQEMCEVEAQDTLAPSFHSASSSSSLTPEACPA